MTIKKFETFNESIDKYAFTKMEKKVIKDVKDLIRKSYFSGFSQGLYKGGMRGTYNLDNLEVSFRHVEDLTLEQIDEVVEKISKEAEDNISKLYNSLD